MKLACCVWALSGPEKDILSQLAKIGFTQIDLQPFTFTEQVAQVQMKALSLKVSCVGLSFGMPADTEPDSADPETRAKAIDHLKAGVSYAADMGADTAYIIPTLDSSQPALDRYAETLITIADFAALLGLKLSIEHFPARALPTAAATLDFIRTINHPNLYLLFDIGHIQITQEDPAAVIREAEAQLGYVHLDDNDGQGDLHWSLLDGVLTPESLQQTFASLAEIDYSGAISLELSPNLPDPLFAIEQSYQIVKDALSNHSLNDQA